MSAHNIYNMPSGVPFLPSLALSLRDMLGEHLPDALILLPTRRAVRELSEAFTQKRGVSFLPRMRPLADIDPDEPPFEPGYLTGLVEPVIPNVQRRFEMAQIIDRYHHAISDLPLDPSSCLAMTDPLLAILDDAALEEVNAANLAQLDDIKDFAAEHFKNALEIYKILQIYWPEHLHKAGLMEPMARRVALLKALTDLWTETPPNHPVIIAGSTGTLGASARLMRCVANMRDGLIILPGLDGGMPSPAWDEIGPEHPQASLKRLLDVLGVTRESVKPWPHIAASTSHNLVARQKIISESLVPVTNTADWPERIQNIQSEQTDQNIFKNAFDGLAIIEARTDDEEALTIALVMRHALETPGKTAALVTPDPALARRVKARLRRWDVNVDYSQGEPLEETGLGSFLSGLLNLAKDPSSPVDLAFVFKHPLTCLGEKPGQVDRGWNALELQHFRGARLAPKDQEAFALITRVHKAISPLLSADITTAPNWARALTQAAETIAAAPDTPGAARLWREDAGEKAARLMEELIAFGDNLGDMSLAQFNELFSNLMRGRVVRPQYGTHPRLQILGPLEARMLYVDQLILGGLNEGIWPATPSIQPFLSRNMRAKMGLSLPEQRFGLAAHDFSELACNPNVILTRASRADDGPKVASRWLWRLQTLAKGALGDAAETALAPDLPFLEWARALDFVPADNVNSAKRPAPKPKRDERWPKKRKLSVTEIRTWVRDPYSIYAKHILGLKPLSDLDEPRGAKEYGSAVHDGLEVFSKVTKNKLTSQSSSQLASEMETAYLAQGFDAHNLSRERVRLRQAASDIVDWMALRRADGWEYAGAENTAEMTIDALDFTLSCRADLIEKSADGFAIIDYKTGQPASEGVVQAGFDLQLPLTAELLQQGAFKDIKAGQTSQLLYVQVRGAGHKTRTKHLTLPDNRKGWSAADYQASAMDVLTKLVRAYDDPDTPYYSQPRIQFANDYGDYDHLARRGEWASLGEESGGE